MAIKRILVLSSLFSFVCTFSVVAVCPCSQRTSTGIGIGIDSNNKYQTTWSRRMKMWDDYYGQRAHITTGNQKTRLQNTAYQQSMPTPSVGPQQTTTPQRMGNQRVNTQQIRQSTQSIGKQKAIQQPQVLPASMSIEWAVLEELNTARTNPQSYISYLIEHKKSFINPMTYRCAQYTIQTKEGTAAVDEAIRFMKNLKPISPLTLSQGLIKAALDHTLDIGPKGIVGHVGSDRSNPGARMGLYGVPVHTWGENLAFGHSDARQIVMQLIIDDGVKDRGHRTNIFNPDFHRVGIAYGGHKTYRCMCAMDFAGEFIEG